MLSVMLGVVRLFVLIYWQNKAQTPKGKATKIQPPLNLAGFGGKEILPLKQSRTPNGSTGCGLCLDVRDLTI